MKYLSSFVQTMSDMTDVEESTIDQEDIPFQDLEAASEVLDTLLDGECSSYLSPEILNRISAKINEVKGTLSTLGTALVAIHGHG